MHLSEQIVADAIMSGDTETGIRQIVCNAAASTMMFCECGNTLDQSTVHVLESIQDGKEQTLAACCKKCAAKHAMRLAVLATQERGKITYRWQTWGRTIPIEPIMKMESVHVGGPAKPAPLKPMTVFQMLRGKEQTPFFKSLCIAIHETTGIAMHAGIFMIDTLQSNPSATIPEDEQSRVVRYAPKCRGMLDQDLSGFAVVADEIVEHKGIVYRRMTIDDTARTQVCTVNDQYLRTCERLAKIVYWYPDLQDDHQAIVGLDKQGRRRAVLACCNPS